MPVIFRARSTRCTRKHSFTQYGICPHMPRYVTKQTMFCQGFTDFESELYYGDARQAFCCMLEGSERNSTGTTRLVSFRAALDTLHQMATADSKCTESRCKLGSQQNDLSFAAITYHAPARAAVRRGRSTHFLRTLFWSIRPKAWKMSMKWCKHINGKRFLNYEHICTLAARTILWTTSM